MDDIVNRLRERAGQYDECDWHGDIELEAALEIELLRAALANSKTAYIPPDERVKLQDSMRLVLDNSALIAAAWEDCDDNFYCGKVVSIQDSK